MALRIDKRTINKEATALVFDLRNSTYLYRNLKSYGERTLIVKMMEEIHRNVYDYLFDRANILEEDFAFNDTGDGYIIVFQDSRHAFTAIKCALHIRNTLNALLPRYNDQLGIARKQKQYGFGIGIHTASARIYSLQYTTPAGHKIDRKLTLGTACNSAARVESMTKKLNRNLLITGTVRKTAEEQCTKSHKTIFQKNSPQLELVVKNKDIKDGREKGHNLYFMRENGPGSFL
jgi:class 3 adenylate cyclase